MLPSVEHLQNELLAWLNSAIEPGELREDLYEIVLNGQKFSGIRSLSRARCYAFISAYYDNHPDDIKYGKCLWAGCNTVYRLIVWVENQDYRFNDEYRYPSWAIIDKILVLFGYQPLLPRIRLGIWQQGYDMHFGNMNYIKECIKYPEQRKRGDNALYWDGFCLCSAMRIKIEVGLDLASKLEIPIFAPLEPSQLDDAGEYRCSKKGTGNPFGIKDESQYPVKKEQSVANI